MPLLRDTSSQFMAAAHEAVCRVQSRYRGTANEFANLSFLRLGSYATFTADARAGGRLVLRVARPSHSYRASLAELAFARLLEHLAVPAQRPAPAPLCGPHLDTSLTSVTVWQYVDHATDTAVDWHAAGWYLDDLRHRLDATQATTSHPDFYATSLAMALPVWSVPRVTLQRLVRLPTYGASALLPATTLASLLSRHSELAAQTPRLFRAGFTPVHGDIPGNILVTDKAPPAFALIDFETSCRGPRTWDWVCAVVSDARYMKDGAASAVVDALSLFDAIDNDPFAELAASEFATLVGWRELELVTLTLETATLDERFVTEARLRAATLLDVPDRQWHLY